jgi:hypothetical protein
LSGRSGPDPVRLVTARLHGAAKRRAGWGELTEPETAAGVAELQEIVAGRDDGPALLAETAGLLLGCHEGDLDEARARGAARLCRLAGADESLIAEWAEEGRRRRANSGKPPFSAPRYRRPGGREA